MNRDELGERTKKFALEVIRLVQSLPTDRPSRIIGEQLLRAGTSVAANHRAARRARSRAEFHAKISIVVEEADETLFWLEIIGEAGIVPKERIAFLLNEADQLVRIFSSSRKTVQNNTN